MIFGKLCEQIHLITINTKSVHKVQKVRLYTVRLTNEQADKVKKN